MTIASNNLNPKQVIRNTTMMLTNTTFKKNSMTRNNQKTSLMHKNQTGSMMQKNQTGSMMQKNQTISMMQTNLSNLNQ